MSELAFNTSGEAFDLPATLQLHIRRVTQRGAPVVVCDKYGVSLIVPALR